MLINYCQLPDQSMNSATKTVEFTRTTSQRQISTGNHLLKKEISFLLGAKIMQASLCSCICSHRSTGYDDELGLGAVWLYRATREQQYLDRAYEFYSSGTPWALSWDDKNAAVQVLVIGLFDVFIRNHPDMIHFKHHLYHF